MAELEKMRGYVPDVRVHVSHYGYHPEHEKKVICAADLSAAHEFELVDAALEQTVFRGPLEVVKDDFGTWRIGDFSAWNREGEYYVRIGGERSFGTFRIRANLWDEYQKMIALHYFGIRRIGEDNVIGNGGALHGVRWDDARLPNGEGWRYVGKSFADGNDRRLYPSVSLIVAQYCLLKRTQPFWDSGDWIYEQVRWGLDGALSFLDKDGILRKMLWAFPDEDTDGIFYSGDEKLWGDAFDQTANCNEYSLENREVVYASLLLGPAEAALLYYDKDPDFFERVKHLCIRGFANIERLFSARPEDGVKRKDEAVNPFAAKYSSSAWAWLCALLHQLTGEEFYMEKAVEAADTLIGLQQREWLGDGELRVRGWYRKHKDSAANPWGEKPEQEVMMTPWLYQSLFRLLELYPDHEKAGAWRESVRGYAEDYLLRSSAMNVFGYTPMKVGEDGLKRRRGTLSYQYFGEIGRMFHQVGNAAYLLSAAKLLGDDRLRQAGMRQIQWFAGINPLGIGCVYGLSGNIPGGQYHAETWGAAIPGGIPNGMTGDAQDFPEVRFWEYYTYASLNGLWFATAAGASKFGRELELWPAEVPEAPHDPESEGHARIVFPVRVKGGFSYRFHALAAPGKDLAWYVNGVEGGSAETGTIDSGGTYRAPFVTECARVTIGTALRGAPGTYAETPVLIMPAPPKVEGLRCLKRGHEVILTWNAVTANCSGYTIWRRLPVTEREAGTIFERVWAVDRDVTWFAYRLNAPHGTQFMVQAYHRSESMIYGYGPPSDIAELDEHTNA